MSAEKFPDIPLISVLIPSYQSEELLWQALKSVLRQDYPALEVVVCDDGSEDFEEERLRKLAEAERALELKIVRHSANVGTVRNLNSGLRLCRGEWVLILAADDVLADAAVVARLAERAKKTQQNWLLGRTLMCDKQLKQTGEFCPTEQQMGWTESSQVLYTALCRGCFLPSSGNLYRMAFLRRMGFFDEHFRLVEDWPLFLKAARSGELPEVYSFPAVLHRTSGMSRSRAGKNRVYQKDLIGTIEREILPYLEALPLKERGEIKRLCEDKRAIYQFRFETVGAFSKLRWAGVHSEVLVRKITQMCRR